MEWFFSTQEYYNEILLFYYRLFLTEKELQDKSTQQIGRELERLTIVGRDKIPVKYPLPWKKVPLYFRRAAINAAIAAGRSYLSRGQQQETSNFCKAVTYYKGMYRNLTSTNIDLKVWNKNKWEWVHCRLKGNVLPEGADCLSPSVVLREKEAQLHVPVKQIVCDGRKAKQRVQEGSNICIVQFTNTDSFAVCMIMDVQGNQKSVVFLKGGKEYVHHCQIVQQKLNKSLRSTGKEVRTDANKKYWKKLKNISNYFSNKVSRQVINICIKEKASILVLPKYEKKYSQYVKKTTGKWSVLNLSYRIKEQLYYKGWQAGIILLEVSTYCTSSICAICGAKIWKQGQNYECVNGHKGNRYLNTARNLGYQCLRGFGKEILQEKEQNH